MITGAGRARHCEGNCSASDNERRDNNETTTQSDNETTKQRHNDNDNDSDDNKTRKTTCDDDANNEKRKHDKRTQVKQSEIRCRKIGKITVCFTCAAINLQIRKNWKMQ